MKRSRSRPSDSKEEDNVASPPSSGKCAVPIRWVYDELDEVISSTCIPSGPHGVTVGDVLNTCAVTDAEELLLRKQNQHGPLSWASMPVDNLDALVPIDPHTKGIYLKVASAHSTYRHASLFSGYPSASSASSLDIKLVGDAIHGMIPLDRRLFHIIDTTHFQRLRNLKQLGALFFVFPTASHNRFEHCMGTSYLAAEQLKRWQALQPHLDITTRDIFRVSVAGLLHDLGHGPFSHTFDGHVIPQLWAKQGLSRPAWSHEEGSIMLFDNLVARYGLADGTANQDMRPLLSRADIAAVKHSIRGTCPTDTNNRFLYDVVSNSTCGIDVDKFDYFRRDSRALGVLASFDASVLMSTSRVVTTPAADGGNLVAAFSSRQAWQVLDLFRTRFTLHKLIYSHRVAKSIEQMVVDMMVSANDLYRFDLAPEDPGRYLKLTDRVLDEILYSDDPRLLEAKNIGNRIIHRQLYKYVAEVTFPWDDRSTNIRGESLRSVPVLQGKVSPSDVMRYADASAVALGAPNRASDIKSPRISAGSTHSSAGDLHEGELFMYDGLISYGAKHHNPIGRCWFYLKPSDPTCRRLNDLDVSMMLPSSFQERTLRIFVKCPTTERVNAARNAFGTFLMEGLGIVPSFPYQTTGGSSSEYSTAFQQNFRYSEGHLLSPSSPLPVFHSPGTPKGAPSHSTGAGLGVTPRGLRQQPVTPQETNLRCIPNRDFCPAEISPRLHPKAPN